MSYKITLTYFKSSGKYYTTGIYYTSEKDMWGVFDEVKDKQARGFLPDLVEGGGREFLIHVDASEHPNGYPALIRPLE